MELTTKPLRTVIFEISHLRRVEKDSSVILPDYTVVPGVGKRQDSSGVSLKI